MRNVTMGAFYRFSQKLSFAAGWVDRFLQPHLMVYANDYNPAGDSHKCPLLTSSVNRYSHCWYLVLGLAESVRAEFKGPPSW